MHFSKFNDQMYDLIQSFMELDFGEDVQRCLSTEKFLKEFRTLNLSVPRRVGKTTILKRLTSENEDCIVITPTLTMEREFKEFNSVFAGRLTGRLGKKYKLILVDEYKMCEEYTRHFNKFILDICKPDSFIICLGTD